MDEALSWDADIQYEVDRKNFIRAAMLAQKCNYPPDAVQHLKKSAIMHFALIDRNLPGLQKLVAEYGIPTNEVRQMLEEELEKQGEEAKSEKSMQFTASKMTPMTLYDWIRFVCSEI